MSRIGKQPITLPSGVEAKIDASGVTVKGSKGEMTSPLFDGITASQEGSQLQLACSDLGSKKMKGNFGLARALLANNVTGVSEGFNREGPRFGPIKLFFIKKQAHKFDNGQRGVRVVQLNRNLVRNQRQIFVVNFKAPQNIRNGSGCEKVFLLESKFTPHRVRVVGIKNFGDVF